MIAKVAGLALLALMVAVGVGFGNSDSNVVATIVEMPPLAPDAETGQLKLRIDDAGQGENLFKRDEVVTLNYTRSQDFTGIGLGDQLRVSLQKVEEGVFEASGKLARLGRGELVNPAKSASEDLGSPDAKLLVKMFAPIGPACHAKTAQLLRDLAAREPNRIRVQIFDMKSESSRAEMRRERLSCATVLVNNRYEFKLKSGESERQVALTHRPNEPGSSYNSEDVVKVVEQELTRICPEPVKPKSD